MKHPRATRPQAFALLEFFVVLAVIAVFAVLLYPVLLKVRQNAYTAKCTATLRNIGQGLANYIGDKGYYPGRVADRRPTFWYEALEPYVTRLPVPKAGTAPSQWCRCPARKGDPSGGSSLLGYGYNMNFGNIPPDHSGFDPQSSYNAYWHITPARVQRPGQVVVIGDNRDDGVVSAFVLSALRSSTNAKDALHPRRHSGGGNFLFADGHVEHMTPEVFTSRIKPAGGDILVP